jgi:thiol-disulfide isomerase/thioredoxin
LVLRLAMAVSFTALAAAAAPAQTAAPAPPRTPSASEPVTSPGNAVWAPDVGAAKSRASTEQKLVFVEFDAPECGHCQRMDSLLYPAMDFEALLLRMVPVKVSIKDAEGRELGARYGIQETPGVLVLTPEGRLVFRMQGFLTTRDFYTHIHADLEKYRLFVKRIEGQDIAHLSAKEALETGVELYQRSDAESALPRLRRAATHPKATAAQRDGAREALAAVELELGQTAASRTTIDRLIATTKDPARRERAELFRAQLPLAENNPEEAVALFRKFQKDHPNSQYAEQVNAMLLRLTEGRTP